MRRLYITLELYYRISHSFNRSINQPCATSFQITIPETDNGRSSASHSQKTNFATCSKVCYRMIFRITLQPRICTVNRLWLADSPFPCSTSASTLPDFAETCTSSTLLDRNIATCTVASIFKRRSFRT